jgi:hypothetical protein
MTFSIIIATAPTSHENCLYSVVKKQDTQDRQISSTSGEEGTKSAEEIPGKLLSGIDVVVVVVHLRGKGLVEQVDIMDF